MKLVYSNAIPESVQEEAELEVSAILFENTSLGDDECDELAKQIVISVVKIIAPNKVFEVISKENELRQYCVRFRSNSEIDRCAAYRLRRF